MLEHLVGEDQVKRGIAEGQRSIGRNRSDDFAGQQTPESRRLEIASAIKDLSTEARYAAVAQCLNDGAISAAEI